MSLVDVPVPLSNSFRNPDFPDGFNFEELFGPKESVQLNGFLMPHVPFNYGGSQRMVKDFYPGQTEPAIHILGPEEKDLTISGRFNDKSKGLGLYGFAQELVDLIDSIRIRGNILRIFMGEYQRYAILKETSFNLKNLSDISYSLTFDIIGFNAPINGKFIEKKREIPFSINNSLIDLAGLFNDTNIPSFVNLSIAELLRNAINAIAGAIALVTDLVNNVISTVNDIKKAVSRALGLIKHVQNEIRKFKKFVGAIDPFNTVQGITGRYESASFYSSIYSSSSRLGSFMQKFRREFIDLTETLPLARYLVKENDTLQTISIQFFNDDTKWKLIMDHNNLQSATLSIGSLLEIPDE